MKKIIPFILALSFSVNLFAQKIEVKQVQEKMSQGRQYGLQVFVPRVDDKDLSKAWKKWTRDRDVKTSSKKSVYFTDDILLTGISENTVDLYTTFDKKKLGVVMTVYFDLGGAFLNHGMHPDQYDQAASLIRDFAVEQSRAAFEVVLNKIEKEYEDLNKKLQDLEKDQKDLEKDIKGWQDDIEKAQKDLQNNAGDQKKVAKDLEDKKKELDASKKQLNDIQ